MEMKHKVSIIIPTKNRFDFIKRQLEYYHSVNSYHPIYIGDSSEGSAKDKLKKIIDNFKNHLDINYFYFPKDNGPTVKMKLADKVTEKYCTYAGDDDFFVPNSLTKCANFLEKNSNYRTAHGKRYIFCLSKRGAYGAIKWIDSHGINGKTLAQTSAKDRIISFSQNYWGCQFSVHRTDEFLEDSKVYRKLKDEDIFHEFLHNFSFISRGKSKYIDCLYLVRQGHEDRMEHSPVFNWIGHQDWNRMYKLFIDSISKILVEIDCIKLEEAKLITQRAFWTQLQPNIYKNTYFHLMKKSKKVNSLKIKTKELLQNYLSTKQINLAKNIRNKISNNKNNLLNKKSKYYKDFDVLNKIITQ